MGDVMTKQTAVLKGKALRPEHVAARARAAQALLKGIKLSEAQTAQVVDRFEDLLTREYGELIR